MTQQIFPLAVKHSLHKRIDHSTTGASLDEVLIMTLLSLDYQPTAKLSCFLQVIGSPLIIEDKSQGHIFKITFRLHA